MRLKKIWISEYKNLKDFTLEFNENSNPDIFVGKNGTGKSNLFECIIDIFRHLYEFEKGTFEINYNYIISYIIDAKEYEITWKAEKLSINGAERKTLGVIPLPDNLLIYYSGHNSKIEDLVKEYEDAFKNRIKNADIKDTRKFIGIDKSYKQLLLTVLLLQKDDCKSKNFIKQKLGIISTGNLLKVVFKRPFYAKDKKFDIINNDDEDRFWKPGGITSSFLNKLNKCVADNSKPPIRTEGYFNSEHKDHPDRYILYFDIDLLQAEFKNASVHELFRQFDNLKVLGMLDVISVVIKLENDIEATTDFFSDGQLQSIYIYSIIEIFKGNNCLLLLDEPDSFLHPEWQFEFLTQVLEISDTTLDKTHILMNTHNASTLVSTNDKKLSLFFIENNNVKVREVSKKYAINQLSAGFIKINEQEQTLSIIHKIRLENKPALFCEGISDPVVIKTAWANLYDYPMPFIAIYAFDDVYLSRLIQDEKIYNEMSGKPLFGLFDFDEAYNYWNGIRNKGNDEETDPYKGLCAKVKNQNGYVFLLPCPRTEPITSQVIKDKVNQETFNYESRLTLELLFYDHVSNKDDNYQVIPCMGGGNKIEFKGHKVNFANNIISTLDKTAFEIFRPMFEFIENKI